METSRTKPVVVGFDGSPDARRALAWATEYATRASLPLRVVAARGDLYSVSEWANDWTRGLAEEWLVGAGKDLSESHVDDAELVVRDGPAAAVLVAESKEADCVVVGRAHRGTLAESLLGTVGHHVTRHAACPVVVVHEPQHRDDRIVVGVDGSDASMAALDFALDCAAPRLSDVEVVYCPEHWKWFADQDQLQPAPEILEACHSRDAAVREQALAAGRALGVELVFREVGERPARTLIDASRHARLVVVGSRGRGGFMGVLLGSVSADVTRHAHCSVAVVR